MAISASQLLGLVEIRGAAESIAKLEGVGRATDSAGAKLAGLAVGGTVLAAAGLVALGAAAVKMDADLQQGINRLRTGGGDIQDTFNSLRTGIQQVAVATGELTGPLIPAMYLIVGAGQRGAQAMDTLKVASEGAQIEQANVADVANVVSGVMTNYGTKVYNATQYMNGLIYAVAHGKITLQDLAVAMGPIDPIAQQLGIHMQDVAAAMTTQTNAMIPAARAATGLRFMMQGLENPTKKARDEMAAMGLDSIKVAEEMKVSLPLALQMIYDAAKKAGPEGSVPFNRAISDMIGGVRGFTAFTALTGPHMQDFINNTKNIGSAMAASTTQVKGWDIAQSNLNIKLDQGRAMLEVLGQNVGELLLPYVSQLLGMVTPLIAQFGQWATATDGLAGYINQLAAFVTYLYRDVQANGAIKEFGSILSDIGSTVNNTVNTALLLLGTIFGTTASQAGKASDAATNVAGGLKSILDTVKPVTDLMSWLSSQFADAGIKGKLLRDALLLVGSAFAGLKIAEFGTALATMFANAGLDVQYFGAKLLGLQYAADIDAMSLTKVGTAASVAGTEAAGASGWFVQLEASLDGAGTAAVGAGTAFGGMGTTMKGLAGAAGPLAMVMTGLYLALNALPPVQHVVLNNNQSMMGQLQQYTQITGIAADAVRGQGVTVDASTKKQIDDYNKLVANSTDANLNMGRSAKSRTDYAINEATRLTNEATKQADKLKTNVTGDTGLMALLAARDTAIMADKVGSNFSGMVAHNQGQMSSFGGWMSNEWGTMARTALSMSSTLSDNAMKNFDKLKGNAKIDMSQMDDSSKGYWNDIAQWIADHPINGVIDYTMATPSATIRGQGGNVRYSASGSDYFPGGPSWVGEGREAELVVGPHLMNIPRGAGIYPMSQLGGGGGASGGQPVQININIAGHNVARVLLPELVTAIRNGVGTVGL